MSEAYWEVYGEAAEIYHDCTRTESRAYNDMSSYLGKAAKEGRITEKERHLIAAVIMRAADPQLDYDLTMEGF